MSMFYFDERFYTFVRPEDYTNATRTFVFEMISGSEAEATKMFVDRHKHMPFAALKF